MPGSEILILAGASTTRSEIAAALSLDRHRFEIAEDDASVTTRLAATHYGAVIAEQARLAAHANAVLREIQATQPDAPIIALAQDSEIASAVALLEHGVRAYVTPPFSGQELRRWVARLAEAPIPVEGREASGRAVSRGVLGTATATTRVRRRLEAFASSAHSVSIRGEVGTPRTLLAETLHGLGPRSSGPFVAIACGALPERDTARLLLGAPGILGRVRESHGGTLYLHGLETLSLPLQARIAQVFEQRRIEPAEPLLDLRIVVAVPTDLALRVSRGEFREDLSELVDVLDLEIPPLRERRLELPFLVESLLRRLEPNSPKLSITPRALVALAEYSFPGNDLELESMLERALIFAQPGAPIDLEQLRSMATARLERGAEGETILPLTEAVRNFEREYLVRALSMTGGHKRRTAERLGVSRKSLWKKLRALGVSPVDYLSGEAPRVGEEAELEEEETRGLEGEEAGEEAGEEGEARPGDDEQPGGGRSAGAS